MDKVATLLDIFNNKAPIGKHFGMTLSYNEEQNAVVDLPYNPNLNHAMGGVHGGVYAVMMDTAGWFTAAVRRDLDCWIATSELSVRFLEPARKTNLKAVGQMIKSGKRQDVVQIYLYDGKEEMIGHAVGTFMVLEKVPLTPEEG